MESFAINSTNKDFSKVKGGGRSLAILHTIYNSQREK